MSEIIKADKDGVTLWVRVVPRSSRNGVGGVLEDAVKITLTAPPVDGAANEALIEILAKLCGLRKGAITILSGHTARQKRVHLSGADLATVKKALGL
jgi:uncharacterized protein (TIGR00251 family)